MAVTIEVDREFGWVVVDIFLLGMAIFWQMSRVGAARRKYGVKVRPCLRFLKLRTKCPGTLQVLKNPFLGITAKVRAYL